MNPTDRTAATVSSSALILTCDCARPIRPSPSIRRRRAYQMSATPTVHLMSRNRKRMPHSAFLPVQSRTRSMLIVLGLFLLTAGWSQLVFCDRFFLPSQLPSVSPLASYFMSTFPGTFASTSSASFSSASASSSAPVAMSFIAAASPVHNGLPGVAECEFNGNPVMDYILERMRRHLPEEKIVVQNGAITIYDASINRFAELARIRPSCLRKLDPTGTKVLLPFEAEIRAASVSAKLKYNFYVTDIYGDYAGNFSHIRLNGTFEANLEEEYMVVAQFNITDSAIVSDSIVFGYVPKWILDWVRSYFDSDNTELYQHLAKGLLQREADSFRHFDMLREAMVASGRMQGREEEERLPLNGIE